MYFRQGKHYFIFVMCDVFTFPIHTTHVMGTTLVSVLYIIFYIIKN